MKPHLNSCRPSGEAQKKLGFYTCNNKHLDLQQEICLVFVKMMSNHFLIALDIFRKGHVVCKRVDGCRYWLYDMATPWAPRLATFEQNH